MILLETVTYRLEIHQIKMIGNEKREARVGVRPRARVRVHVLSDEDDRFRACFVASNVVALMRILKRICIFDFARYYERFLGILSPQCKSCPKL